MLIIIKCLMEMSRPVIGSLAAFGACAALWLAQPSAALSTYLLVTTILISVTGAGFVINDYFDIEKDKINHPNRPLPSGRLKPQFARVCSLVLFVCGNILALFLTPAAFTLVFVNSVLLFYYSRILIWNGIIGNLVTAYLSASVCLFGVVSGGASFRFILPSVFIFLVVMLREIIFDLRDQDGDKSVGMKTVATLYGADTAFRIAWLLYFASVTASLCFAASSNVWNVVFIGIGLFLVLIALVAVQRDRTAESYTRFVSLTRWSLFILILSFVAASPRLVWATTFISFGDTKLVAPGAAGYIVVGLAIAFYYISSRLLTEFHSMSRETFDQMDPRWRFYSVYGGLMMVIMVQLFTYAWHVSMTDMGFFQAFVQDPHWLRHVALAIGFLPLPVIWLELLYSQHWNHIGFTPYYESNLGKIPYIRELVQLHSEVRQDINKFPKTRLKLIRHLYSLSVFISSWLFYYVVSPLCFIHLYKNWKRVEIDREGKHWLQVCMDIFVIVSLYTFFLTIAFLFLQTNKAILELLIYFPFLLTICAVLIALLGMWLVKPHDYNVVQYGSYTHLLLGCYAFAVYLDAKYDTYSLTGIFGGWAPWVLTFFLLLLSNGFLRDLTEARRRTAGWLREGLSVNFTDRVLHRVSNLLQPPQAALQTAREWFGSEEKLQTLLVNRELRSEVLRSMDNGLYSVYESYEDIRRLKLSVRENKMPTWHPVTDLLSIIDTEICFANGIRRRPSITPGPPGLELQVNKEQFGAVIQNLVENAADALRMQGHVNPEIQVQVNLEMMWSGGCAITVLDNGPGIRKENQEKVYQPWFSTKSTGSGMGLFIVRQFMTELGGFVWLETKTESDKHTYTKFTLQFPSSKVRIKE